MSKGTKYSDEPIGEIESVPDFLPSPEALTPKTKDSRSDTLRAMLGDGEKSGLSDYSYKKLIKKLDKDAE